MKSMSAELLAHYQSGSTSLARIWKITRTDGQIFGFTDHDRAITFESVPYEPSSVFDASSVSTRSELNVDNLESTGLLSSAGITAEDIEAGLWDGAAIEFLEVNWRDLSMGANVLRAGTLGEVQRDGLTYKAEMRGLMHKLQNNIGRIVTPSCDATLGDARCGVDLEVLRVSGVVTATTDARTFTDAALVQAEGYFSYGKVAWVTGANAGRSMEVKQHSAGGALLLQLPMAFPISVDDEFTIVPGCDKTKAVCIAKFSNVLNFRGFSFVPGQTKVMLVGGQ